MGQTVRPPSSLILSVKYCILGKDVSSRIVKTASQHYRTPSRAIGRSTPDPTWKRSPGRPCAKWTDQLRRDNNNVPIATRSLLVAVTRERRYGPCRLRVNDDGEWKGMGM